MKHAVQLPQYSDTRQFAAPQGVSTVRLDKVTNLLADASCPQDYDAVFLDGTAPTQTCDQSAGDQRNVFQKIFGIGKQTTRRSRYSGERDAGAAGATVGSQAAAAPHSRDRPRLLPTSSRRRKKASSEVVWGKGDNDNKQPQPDPNQPH